MIISNDEGVIQHVNRSSEKLFGYSCDEIVGQPIELLIPESFRRAHREHVQRFFIAPKDRDMGFGGEFSAMTREGREFSADISLRTLDIEGERVAVAAVRDISDRKRTDKALQEQKEFLAKLIDSAQTIVLMLDMQGRIVLFNRYAETITGYAADDVLGKDWFATFLPKGEQRQVRMFFNRVLKDGGHTAHINPIVAKDGQLREIEWYGRILEDKDGTAIGVLSTGQDVTKRKANEEILRKAVDDAEQANLAKSQFMAAASHDLRQPLQSLILYIGALERKAEAPEILDIVMRMKLSLEGMRELLDSLLDITRYDSGQVEPDIKVFPITDILYQAEADVRPLAEEKGLKFRVVFSSALVSSDPALLDRVVQNFLFNAIRYTEKGSVLVGCRRRGDRLRIEVWDTGSGISEGDKGRIFQEFVQLENPARERKKGMGLGLAVVDRIARLLNHEIDVVSVPGSGSVFAIEVPVGAKMKKEPTPANNIQGSLGPEKILALIVEDDPAILGSLETLLKLEGFEVTTAEHVGDVENMIERKTLQPDIIISDYSLPGGKNGLDAIRQVRLFCGRRIPATLITGDTSGQILRQARVEDCRVLNKPVDADALLSLIGNLLNGTD